ncbi:MAG: ribonuclease P protein component [Desulfobacterales bacterium]|nr:ribonuclease P protein component [Desulfobacterales bacterium]
MGLFGFSKADRLLKRSEFIELSKCGKKIQNKQFIVIYSPSRVNRKRLGITVSKKVGKAAERNRIKRQTREFFRLNRHNISGFWDINIIARKEVAGLATGLVHSSLKEVFDKMLRQEK